MAASTNLYIEQGSDFIGEITLEQKDLGGNIIPVDLTGFTIKSHMRKSYASQNPAAIFTVVIVDAVNGQIELQLDNATTGALKYGRYVYDVMIETGGSIRDRVLEGNIIVTPGVTDFDL